MGIALYETPKRIEKDYFKGELLKISFLLFYNTASCLCPKAYKAIIL